MPSFSSHAMAALMSARWPSSSRQTIPISSVTLTCRRFVATGNLWPSCQITGAVMSRGGYISQRRLFCLPLADSAALREAVFDFAEVFFEIARGIGFEELRVEIE